MATRARPPITDQLVSATVQSLIGWFQSNARDLPWRKTKDPYAIWIAEIMLQQTQVATVIPYWERWMGRLPSIARVAEVPEETVLKLWEGLGYYSRARNIQKAARQMVERHGGVFPESHADILALPGIGPYTAGAISSIAFDRPEPLLDGNVIRVAARFLGIVENPKEKAGAERFWAIAKALVGEADSLRRKMPSIRVCSDLNQSLMELGALICLPRNPRCGECPVRRDCLARREGKIEQLPNLPERVKTTHRQFEAFVFSHGELFLVRRRPDTEVNGGFWEFPNEEIESRPGRSENFGKAIGIKMPRAFLSFSHSITRYRIRVRAVAVTLDETQARQARERFGGEWLAMPAIFDLPFTSAHRKIAKAAMAGKG